MELSWFVVVYEFELFKTSLAYLAIICASANLRVFETCLGERQPTTTRVMQSMIQVHWPM